MRGLTKQSGVGAGQMSRVDSVQNRGDASAIAVAGSVLASDAFFPFRDGIDEAAKHGITAVIQPGGSVRDEEVIRAARRAWSWRWCSRECAHLSIESNQT